MTRNPTVQDYMVAVTDAQATLGLTDKQLTERAGLPNGEIGRMRKGQIRDWALARLSEFFAGLLPEGTMA